MQDVAESGWLLWPRFVRYLALLACACFPIIPLPAHAVTNITDIQSVSEQKISDTAGYLSGPGSPGTNPGGLLENSDQFGIAAASPGDFDGDGITDLAVGAIGDDDGGSSRGAVYLLLLNADATVKSRQKLSSTSGGFSGVLDNFDSFGRGLAWLGDLDGDGIPDLAVGASGDDDGGANRGAVWILFLNANGTVKSHQKISDTAGGFTGLLDTSDAFGVALKALGDLDGDGVPDLAVGAHLDDDGGSNRGAVWILFLNADGTVKSHQKISDTTGGFTGVLSDTDAFGDSIEVLGDQDGDGVVDIAVGASQDDDGGTDRGAVWILFLNTDGTVKAHQKISSTAGGFAGALQDDDYFGIRLAIPGDLDGDGVFELAVGARGDDDGGVGRGAVWILLLNADGTVKGQYKFSDTQGGFTGVLDDSDYFGFALASLGDMDGNGLPELAVGASGDDDGGNNRGAIWTLFLNTVRTPALLDIQGTAQGGSVQITVDGVVVFITTVAAQTEQQVVASLAAAINATTTLQGRGVSATANGGQLSTNGLLLDVLVNDAGLLAQADLDVDLTATLLVDANSNGYADPGDELRMIATVTNNGSGPVSNAVFRSVARPEAPLIAGTVTVIHGTLTQGNTAGDTSVTVALDSLPAGGSAVIAYRRQIANPLPAGVNFISLSDLVEINPSQVQISDDPSTPEVGDPVIVPVGDGGILVTSTQKISDTAGYLTNPGNPGTNPGGLLNQDDGFAISAASAGDFDGDGITDLAVGAFRDDDGGTDLGAVYLLLLNADGTVKSRQVISATSGSFTGILGTDDTFGLGLDWLGDLDGDGVQDLAVGARNDDDGSGFNQGAVWILFLNPDGTVKSHQKISATAGGFTGVLDHGDRMGNAIRALGDLDGDGVTDIAVGMPSDDDTGTNRGSIWILFLNADGTVKGHQKISDAVGGFTGVLNDGDLFGESIEVLGDLDGDGVADLAVGADTTDDGGFDRGAVWILFLNADGTVKGHQKISDTAGGFTGTLQDSDYFGYRVASLGDVDGDGSPELAVGSFGNDDGGTDRGAVWILSLNADGTVKDQRRISDTEGAFTGVLDGGDNFSTALASLPDMDGNGLPELAVGAWHDDDGGTDRGAVWTLFLRSFSDLSCTGNPALCDDSDNDGIPDVVDPYPLDTDNDGLDNVVDPDDDNDGIPDNVEIAWGLNSLDVADASLDLDNDTFDNLAEYRAGTSLSNPAESPGTVTDLHYKILASDGAAGELYGLVDSHSVAIEGNTALVGVWLDSDQGQYSGAVYVYERDGNGIWAEHSKLLAGDGVAGGKFGYSVALSGDTALLGASGVGGFTGAAYVFVRDNGGNWIQQAKLLATDGASFDEFGGSVSLSGDTALIGAQGDNDNGAVSGSAYIFTRDTGGNWSQQDKLLATNGSAGDLFGSAVSIHGNTALIGAPQVDDLGTDTGLSYVFTDNGAGNWVQQALLSSLDAKVDNNRFGNSVSLDGDTALVGSLVTNDAYIFVRDAGGNWSEQAKLSPADGMQSDNFGNSVALRGDLALVGAKQGDDNGSQSGSVYLFSRDSGGTWSQWKKLLAGDGEASDYFGKSVALGTGTVLASASGDDDNGTDAGAAYIFELDAAAPMEQVNVPAIKKGTGDTVEISSAELEYSDDYQAPQSIIYTVTVGPVNGRLELITNSGVAITTFTQDDIDNNQVVYVRTNPASFADSFSFEVNDGRGHVSPTKVFNLVFDPVHHYNFERMWPTLSAPWYFDNIVGLAIGSHGEVYLADSELSFVRKYTSNGNLITEWPITVPLDYDIAMAVSGDGSVYALLPDNVSVVNGPDIVKKYSSEGVLKDEWPVPSAASPGELDIDVGPFGNVFVLDFTRHIRKYTPTGQELFSIGLPVSDIDFGEIPKRLALNGIDTMYVTIWDDSSANDLVYRFDLGGQLLQPASFATSLDIIDIDVDNAGNVLVSGLDAQGNYRVMTYDSVGNSLPFGNYDAPVEYRQFTVSQVDNRLIWFLSRSGADPQDTVHIRAAAGDTNESAIIGEWTSRGDPVNGLDSVYAFNEPDGIASNSSVQEVFVADRDNNRIKVFASDGSYLRTLSNLGGLNRSPWQITTEGQSLFVASQGSLYELDLQGNLILNWTSSVANVGFVWSLGLENGLLFTNGPSTLEINVFDSSGVFLRTIGFQSMDNRSFQPISWTIAPNTADIISIERFGQQIWVHRQDSATGNPISSTLLETPVGFSDVYNPHDLLVDSDGFFYVFDGVSSTLIKYTPEGFKVQILGSFGVGAGQFLGGDPNAQSPVNHWNAALDDSGRIYVVDRDLDRVQSFRPVVQANNTRAIVVAGGGPYPGNHLWNATRAMANKAYDTLISQGFHRDDILYLSEDSRPVVDDTASKATIESAITSWALEDIDGNGSPDAENIIIYMDDHGGDQTFRVRHDETLTANELNVWLTTLEAGITGDVVLIYDACLSGSFSPIANPRRKVITSAGPSEVAYYTGQGLMSFSNYFLNAILNGNSVGNAFSAAWKGVNSTSSSQTPQLDADGDGTVNQGFDSSGSPITTPATSGDYAASETLSLGSGTDNFLQGPKFCDPQPCTPQISAAITSGSTGTITANGLTDADGVNRVWATIFIPNPPLPDPENPVTDLPTVELLEDGLNPGNYSATWPGFTSGDTYQIVLYAMDALGNTSPPQLITLAGGNSKPRRAVIVAGDDAVYWQAAVAVYQALRAQGYADSEIQYRSAGGTTGVDGSPSVANIQGDLAAMNGTNSGDVTLFLIGSSDGSAFTLNGTEALAASTLDSWLDTVVTAIPGKLTVVMDADNAGFYLERLDLTQASGGSDFYRLASTISGTAHFEGNGSVSYTQFFAGNVTNGATVPIAHLLAKTAMQAASGGQQQVWLDSNSDDISDKYDISRILNYSLGPGILLAGDEPVIGSAGVDGFSAAAAPMAVTLWADDITTTGTLDEVWALVTSPDTDGFGGNDPVTVTVPLTDSGTRFESNYNLPSPLGGTYTVSFYASDTDGAVSLPWIETLTREDAYEPDNDETEISPLFVDAPAQYHSFHVTTDKDWVTFTADDGKTYTITADPVGETADVVLFIRDPNGDTTTIDALPTGAHPLGAETYIVAVDSSNDGIFQVKVSLDNTVSPPNLPSDYTLAVTTDGGGSGTTSVAGQVREPGGNPVELAFVKVTGVPPDTSGTSSTLSVTPNGDYSIGDGPGTYTLTATKTGYQPVDAGTIIIPEQGTTIRNITLTSDGTGDTDGDGIPDASDPYPYNVDGDGDGLCDGPVTIAGVCVAGEDLNANGVVDSGETDPTLPDTDGDTFNDGMEVLYGSDPLNISDTPENNHVNNGDVNGVGGVDAADVLLATRIILNQYTPTDVEKVRADMVPDGVINAGDVVRIQQSALGMQ